eukprot:GHRR01001283.1.p1 GENE.GHRR01001283.1~~GHRR01001283.1.p1  ORF type:complete len:156 (+),score=54.11 GHRR01001283.1:204-671(+)
MAPPQHDCLGIAITNAGILAAAGLPVGFFRAHATLKNRTLAEKMQRWNNFKLTGRILANPMATFAACGFAYTAANCEMRKYLARDDVLNGMVGGIAAGTVLGLKTNSSVNALKYSVLFAGAMLVTDFLTKMVPNTISDLKTTGPVELSHKPGTAQ